MLKTTKVQHKQGSYEPPSDNNMIIFTGCRDAFAKIVTPNEQQVTSCDPGGSLGNSEVEDCIARAKVTHCSAFNFDRIRNICRFKCCTEADLKLNVDTRWGHTYDIYTDLYSC